nr:MAG TPA: hypothetical protein [Caudoviricetes sp.]
MTEKLQQKEKSEERKKYKIQLKCLRASNNTDVPETVSEIGTIIEGLLYEKINMGPLSNDIIWRIEYDTIPGNDDYTLYITASYELVEGLSVHSRYALTTPIYRDVIEDKRKGFLEELTNHLIESLYIQIGKTIKN